MPTHAHGVSLLERDADLHAIRALVQRAANGRGQLAVVEGEAGIGKSALLAHAARLAAEHGLQCLRGAGSELEQLHSFGVAASVLLPLVRPPRGAVILGPDNPARAVFDPEGRTGQRRPADPLAIIHALQWLVIDASEAAPLAIIVDDAHWADEPSLRFLGTLTHRIASIPVALLIAMRPTTDQTPGVLEQLGCHPEAVRLRLERLSRGAVDALVSEVVDGEFPANERDRIWAQAAGNPFYTVELARAAHAGSSDAETSVPDTIRASIRRRLAEAGATARAIGEAIALLGDDADLSRVAALARVDADEAAAVVRRMIDGALLDRSRVAFTHPVVRATILDDVPAAVRPRLHQAAAALLADAGATVSAAAHLLATTPGSDSRVAHLLHEAGRIAAAQGDTAAARRYLLRAIEEPPPPDALGSVLVDVAAAEANLGLPTAPARFDEAIPHLDLARARAEARLAQGHAYIGSARWREGALAFEAGLAEVDDEDVELRSRLEAGFVSSAYVGLHEHEDASRRLERILAAPLDDPAHRELAAWSAFQQSLAVSATAAEAAALARRAVQGVPLDRLIDGSQAVELAAGVFVATGDLHEEVELLDAAIDAARRLGAHQKVGIFAYCRSLPNILLGRLPEAVADAETALAAHQLGWEVFYPGTLAGLAWARLELGQVAAASRALEMDDERWKQRLDYQFMVPIARGRVAAAHGNHHEAVEQFNRARDAGVALNLSTPAVLGDWRTWCAASLRRLGRRDEAVALAEESLALAERWGATMGLARAHWALGISYGGDAGIDHLRHARDLLVDHPARLELTRTCLDLGAALRRAGRLTEARDVLRDGAELAHRLGVAGMLGPIEDELRAAGARPRRYAMTGIESLTPSELRVSRLVARGLTNREAAQALFVTPKAIEYHLANAYRKLAISSRSELAAALESEAADEVASV